MIVDAATMFDTQALFLLYTTQVWSSDNGGAVHLGGGANSYPLRGGYYNK